MGGCTRYFVGFALFHQKLHFLTGFCAERIYTYKCSWENTHSSQGIIWEAKMGWFSRHPLIFWCPFLKFCNLLLHPKDKCSKSSLWTILTLHRNLTGELLPRLALAPAPALLRPVCNHWPPQPLYGRSSPVSFEKTSASVSLIPPVIAPGWWWRWWLAGWPQLSQD